MPDYAERVMKVRIPIDDRIDWLGELEAFRRKYGRKPDPGQIDRLLHERFGERLYIDANVLTSLSGASKVPKVVGTTHSIYIPASQSIPVKP